MGDHLDPDNITAYNFQPRWSDSAGAGTEESEEGGTVARPGEAASIAPPADPSLLDAQSVAEWDGRDVETVWWQFIKVAASEWIS